MKHPHPGDASAQSYWAAVRQADQAVDVTLAGIRAKEAASELTVVESANLRIAVLEQHLVQLEQLRLEHLGTEDTQS